MNRAAVKKWARTQHRLFTALQKKLEKTDDADAVVKELDVSEPSIRTFRNSARKLKREFPTPARFRQKLRKEVAGEVKLYGKLVDLL